MILVCSNVKTARCYRQALFEEAGPVLLWSMRAWVTGPLSLVLYRAEKWKCWWWGFAFRQQSFSRKVGCGREERQGSRSEVEEEVEEGVRNVRTRSVGDHSPGSSSVWQQWKFIAIDFVISSLSIGSTWAHWWIARKLFLQSCFFKVHPSYEDHKLCAPCLLPSFSLSLFFPHFRTCLYCVI